MSNTPITKAQLDALEQAADKVFGRLGIDIEFTKHFLDRVNDNRNRKQITIHELATLFKKEYIKWGRKISDMPVNSQAVMKDLSSELNIPFVLDQDGDEKDLVAKTVMRKKDFKTPNTELPVESVTPGSQVKGNEPIPKKQKVGKGPNSPHPMRGRLVGESTKGLTRNQLPKNAKISEHAVFAAWEQYQIDERVMDPREAILRKALSYIDQKIKADKKNQMGAKGHAFSVANEFAIGMTGRQLFDLYKQWKQNAQVVESFFTAYDDNSEA